MLRTSAVFMGLALLGAGCGLSPEEAERLLHGAETHGPANPAKAIDHVLLLSIDGMHETDLARFIDGHPASALSQLAGRGVVYSNAWVNRLDGSATNPSDSFPGLLALTTGGSSPTTGGWYDVSYARDVFPYSATAPCAGAPGAAVAYDETIELDNTHLWGNATDDHPTHDPAVVRSRLDTTLLPYQRHGAACQPVYPHQYLRVNTIFEVAKEAGLHTAWSDKHLAYELVTGPSGAGLDDFFAPEINSLATNLVPTATAGAVFTDNFAYTEAYDDYKVAAILNEIAGRYSDAGLPGALPAVDPGVPALFGMNFQAVSVAQKDASGQGGYLDAQGTPGTEVADALAHTDASIGRMVEALRAHGLLDSTVVIVTAKHGQSPIAQAVVQKVDGDAVAALVDGAAPVAGHIEDDVALYWLKDGATAGAAAAALTSPTASPNPFVDKIFTTADPMFARMFGDPSRDPRTPDVIVQPKVGVIYSLSKKKFAEHGGFAEDDAHVGLLVSNPALHASVNTLPVRTKQVAVTALTALGLDPRRLDAVKREGTAKLPGLPF